MINLKDMSIVERKEKTKVCKPVFPFPFYIIIYLKLLLFVFNSFFYYILKDYRHE